MKPFSAYRLQIKSSLDPEWKIYRMFLPLFDLWRHIELGKALIKHLESHGDNLKTPRIIDHSADFTASDGRDAFIQWAAENGFTIRKSANLADAAAAELNVGFERLGTYDATFLYHLQYRIILALARTGGRYLGSGSSVIPKK